MAITSVVEATEDMLAHVEVRRDDDTLVGRVFSDSDESPESLQARIEAMIAAADAPVPPDPTPATAEELQAALDAAKGE